jgi:solute carrier family 25 carnitine/acylcarnitine transporter 20/29
MQVQGLGESFTEYKHLPHQYKGPLDCLMKMHKAEGFMSVYRGLNLTILREIPAFSTYFVSYKYFCDQFSPTDPQLETSLLAMLFAGGLAGVSSWVVTYPIDFVKSRIQADGVNSRPMYTGAIDCIKKTYRSEGYRAFFRGMNASLLRAFPVNAVTFVTVEIFLDWAKVDNEDPLLTDVTMHKKGQAYL